MYGYVYLTTNLINGRKYVGQHHSESFDPNYRGSGKLILQAVSCYGAENFKVEILEECDSEQDLHNCEAKWIRDLNAVESDEYYNLVEGGCGHHWKIAGISIKSGVKISEKARCNASISHLGVYSSWSDDRSKQKSESMKGSNNFFYGKSFSDETLARFSKLRRNKRWINNGVDETTVYQYQVDMYLGKGWKRGRIPFSKPCDQLSYYINPEDIGIFVINNGDEEMLLSRADLDGPLYYTLLNNNWRAGQLLSKYEQMITESETTIERVCES